MTNFFSRNPHRKIKQLLWHIIAGTEDLRKTRLTTIKDDTLLRREREKDVVLIIIIGDII